MHSFCSARVAAHPAAGLFIPWDELSHGIKKSGKTVVQNCFPDLVRTKVC